MPATLSKECLSSAGAVFGEYAGAPTPVSFGDAAAEFAALRTGCAMYDMAWRAKLIVSGEDRVRWMNGMVTNNIRDLQPQRGNYSYLLSAQGRIQGDATVYHRGDYLLLLTEQSQMARLLEYLNRYIIMDDVELTEVSEKLSAIGVAGPQAAEILGKAGLLRDKLEQGEVRDLNAGGIGYSIAHSPIEKRDGYEIWVAPENYARMWETLQKAGAKPVGSQALEWYRITLGLPRIGADIGERELPQETSQEYTLHYAKGCYLGQEIVERIHSRGNVHRSFSAIEVAGEAPAKGTKIFSGEKEAGEVTSSARIPMGGGAERTVALGFLRRDASMPGTELKVGDAAAKVVASPVQD